MTWLIWHALWRHDHEMVFPRPERPLDWEFRCRCGHCTVDEDEALWLDVYRPALVVFLGGVGLVAWCTVLVLWWLRGGSS